MRFALLLSFAAVLAVPVFSAERPSDERIAALVKEYADKINPTLDPELIELRSRRIEIPRLWEEMGAEVIDVGWYLNGDMFNGYVGLYRDGKLSVLAPNLAGRGLMSGVVSKGVFYYTFSWGLHIHRSHVGKFEVVDGKPVNSTSGGFSELDLFVSTRPDGAVQVSSGRYLDVNKWDNSRDFGTPRQELTTHLAVLAPNGKPIEPEFPK